MCIRDSICGSADIYTTSGKGPEGSINFVTCHDGFTLNDLVSYRYKHNEPNGENNRDGTGDNFSENCGTEGDTADAGIDALRNSQIKNFLLTVLISRGVPMSVSYTHLDVYKRQPLCHGNLTAGQLGFRKGSWIRPCGTRSGLSARGG